MPNRERCFQSKEDRGVFLEVTLKLGLEGWLGGGLKGPREAPDSLSLTFPMQKQVRDPSGQ